MKWADIGGPVSGKMNLMSFPNIYRAVNHKTRRFLKSEKVFCYLYFLI